MFALLIAMSLAQGAAYTDICHEAFSNTKTPQAYVEELVKVSKAKKLTKHQTLDLVNMCNSYVKGRAIQYMVDDYTTPRT